MVTSRGGLSGIERRKKSLLSVESQGQCLRGDQCSFRHNGYERAKSTPTSAPPSDPPTQRGRSASREKGASEAGSP